MPWAQSDWKEALQRSTYAGVRPFSTVHPAERVQDLVDVAVRIDACADQCCVQLGPNVALLIRPNPPERVLLKRCPSSLGNALGRLVVDSLSAQEPLDGECLLAKTAVLL